MRQEYTRLAKAELQFDIPWIIDEMDNPAQKGMGGMPNMEFVIDSDGTLLASWDWASPDELKKFLEKKIGPSGISDEEWKELSTRPRIMVSLTNNDEVPGTEVPRSSLSPLDVRSVSGAGTKKPPFSLEAGTLPPEITPDGQSRLYLTIIPDETSGLHFDNSQGTEIHFSDPKGIDLKKDKILAGTRRRGEDVYPHAVGVMWSKNEGAKDMGFTATVVAKMAAGEEESKEYRSTFQVTGQIPVIESSIDEIIASKLPPKRQLKDLKVKLTSEEKVPFNVEASIYQDPASPKEGTVYLFFKVDKGYNWNNLTSPLKVGLKPISGAELQKNAIQAGRHEGSGDSEDRILVFRLKKEDGANKIDIDITPNAWVCSGERGWCRQFEASFKITGKL